MYIENINLRLDNLYLSCSNFNNKTKYLKVYFYKTEISYYSTK